VISGDLGQEIDLLGVCPAARRRGVGVGPAAEAALRAACNARRVRVYLRHVDVTRCSYEEPPPAVPRKARPVMTVPSFFRRGQNVRT